MVIEIALAATIHFLPGEWNDSHPSIRLEHKGWTLGAFHNSEGNSSLAGGYVWRDDCVFIELGLATGYEVSPVVPMIRGGFDNGDFKVFAMPGGTSDGDLGLVVGAEVNLFKF